jgi:hypothetical protein
MYILRDGGCARTCSGLCGHAGPPEDELKVLERDRRERELSGHGPFRRS